MQELADVISATASLAWPGLAAVLAFKFYGPLKGLIESVRGRKFSIKVGDNELTVEEASEQQRLITNDIQEKLAELEKRLAAGQPVILADIDMSQTNAKRILWVDDNPRNNSFFVAALQEQGHYVEIALSTDDGISKFQSQSYDIVISDMARPEGGRAGIILAKQIRSQGSEVPLYIYCGGWAARELRREALQAGVTEITSSGTTLLSLLPLSNGS